MDLSFDIELTSKQQEVYDAMHDPVLRYIVAIMSRQIGKTVIAEVVLIEQLVKGGFSAYISPTFSQGKKVYSEILAILRPTGLIESANGTDLIIETVTGGKLKFFSMESPNAIRGYTVTGILVIDEAAFIPVQLPDGSDPWGNVIFPITKAHKPKVLIISTPNGKKGMFYTMVMRAKDKAKANYKLIKATIYDDRMVSEEEIEEIKASMPEISFRQEFLVEFLDDAMTVFPGYSDRFLKTWRKPMGFLWMGIDVSSVGSDRTVVSVIDKQGNVYQKVVEGSLDDKYDGIARQINLWKPQIAYIEDNSIGSVMANEIRKRLHNKAVLKEFTTTNDSKREYIGLIAVAVANGTVTFQEGNELLKDEMGTFAFRFTKGGRVTYAAREGFHDDTVTSLGICMQARQDYPAAGQVSVEFVQTHDGSINNTAVAFKTPANPMTAGWYGKR